MTHSEKIESKLANRSSSDKPAGGIDLSGVQDQTNLAVDDLFEGILSDDERIDSFLFLLNSDIAKANLHHGSPCSFRVSHSQIVAANLRYCLKRYMGIPCSAKSGPDWIDVHSSVFRPLLAVDSLPFLHRLVPLSMYKQPANNNALHTIYSHGVNNLIGLLLFKTDVVCCKL